MRIPGAGAAKRMSAPHPAVYPHYPVFNVVFPRISVSLLAAISSLTTGRPLLKKSMMVAKISGFMRRHS